MLLFALVPLLLRLKKLLTFALLVGALEVAVVAACCCWNDEEVVDEADDDSKAAGVSKSGRLLGEAGSESESESDDDDDDEVDELEVEEVVEELEES